jgi:16S rRNA (uracil1498-N3)-methyltransferase
MLPVDEARYLREVLRLKVDDEVYVFNGEGQEYQCRVEESRRDSATLTLVGEVDPAKPESPLNLTLAVALLKGEKFDLVVQKTTELGVVQIVPMITKLADVRVRDASDVTKRGSRWQRIAQEAAKQCGRARIPAVVSPVSFENVIKRGETDCLTILFSEREGQSLKEVCNVNEVNQVTALIGSEGGWTDRELSQAKAAGCLVVTLGGRTLRAETAAIAIATLLQHLFGDLR